MNEPDQDIEDWERDMLKMQKLKTDGNHLQDIIGGGVA